MLPLPAQAWGHPPLGGQASQEKWLWVPQQPSTVNSSSAPPESFTPNYFLKQMYRVEGPKLQGVLSDKQNNTPFIANIKQIERLRNYGSFSVDQFTFDS